MSGEYLSYLTLFFNSSLFRFCFKDKFPELLGETRELRKVFFETIAVKTIEDETWFTEKLENVITAMNNKLPTQDLQDEIEKKFFDLYKLSGDERILVKSQAST
jgi:hypothetical protein